jgi:WD40 repeat protein
MYQKTMFLFILSLFLLSAGTQVQSQEYTNDTLWQASVGGTITDIFFSPDDKYLVVVGYNSDLCPSFFDTKTGELLFRINEAWYSFFGSFSTDGEYFLCEDNKNWELLVYNLKERVVEKRIKPEYGTWISGTFINDSKTAWISMDYSTSTNDDTAKMLIFDTKTWEIIHQITGVYSELIKSSPDGMYVGYRSDDDIVVMNTETYKFHKAFEMPERINDFAFSPDGTMIAGTCQSTNLLRIWDLQTGKVIKEYIDDIAWELGGLCFSRDSRNIVVAYGYFVQGEGIKGGSRVLDIEKLKIVHEYPNGGTCEISNDNKFIAFSKPIVYHAKWGETSVSEFPEEENIIYPNPATGIVNILIDIKKAETIDVNIYDTSGNIITNIFNGIAEPGTILTWDSSRHPSGTYYCKVESRSFNRTYKIIVSK